MMMTMKRKVNLIPKECQRCGYIWTPRKKDVKECPACKSRYWRAEPKRKERG